MITATCNHLRQHTFDPHKGFHYDWTPEQAPSVAAAGFNVTFSVQWNLDLYCGDPDICCPAENEVDPDAKHTQCPPPTDGRVADYYWGEDNTEYDICYINFLNTLGTTCHDDTGGWFTGGWLYANSFVYSIMSHTHSPTWYTPLQGDGSEIIALEPAKWKSE
ncbi:hypothetical protein LTR51_004990 [Lithohypha guttulata]|nr:hypothetical protein LTR51_004990 [Lithohypha guttulata]